jgi:hypothetical protein
MRLNSDFINHKNKHFATRLTRCGGEERSQALAGGEALIVKPHEDAKPHSLPRPPGLGPTSW